MLITQIIQTNNSVQIDTVETILAGGVVSGRVECRMKRPHCAAGKSKPATHGLSLYSAWRWLSAGSFERADAGASGFMAATGPVHRQISAHQLGRRDAVSALSS